MHPQPAEDRLKVGCGHTLDCFSEKHVYVWMCVCVVCVLCVCTCVGGYGGGIGDDDVAPLSVEGGEIEKVTESYLGPCLCNDGHVELQKP